MNDKISIIVPVYNAGIYLERCLNSIINQTYKNIEIIIVNDGSTDCSLEIIKKYMILDNRIIFINKENAGVSVARNIGLAKSTGKYIMFIDADDWINQNAIEILYRALITSNVEVVRGNYRLVNENNDVIKNGDIIKKIGKKINNPKSLISNYIYDKNNIPCYSVLLLVDATYKIKFNENISFMEDTIYYFDVLNTVKSILVIPDIIYNYYINDASCVNNPKNFQINIDQILKVNKILKLKESINIGKINTKHISIIISILEKIYNVDKDLYYNTLSILNANTQYLEMKKKISFKNWNVLTIIKIKLLIHKQYKILSILFELKKWRNK